MYFSEKFLPTALESVKNQTYTNWELLITIDGSNDNSEKIIKEFSQKNEIILVYFKYRVC